MMKTEQKIIMLLSDYPEREFYGQEIAEKIKCSKASASALLRSLAVKKVIFKKTKGHMNFYRINARNPEIKKFRITSVLNKISPVLSRLGKISRKIILFGSGSRGEQTAGSDIDLFILADNKKAAHNALTGLNPRMNIKAVIKTPAEWSEMEIREPEFYREIKNGITLHEYVPRI